MFSENNSEHCSPREAKPGAILITVIFHKFRFRPVGIKAVEIYVLRLSEEKRKGKVTGHAPYLY